MSFLYTSATLHHITPLPAGVTKEVAVRGLHDHNHILRGDPEYESHIEIPRESTSAPFTASADSDTKRYRVTDHMPGLPKALGLPQSITFDCEITNVPNGIDWAVKAPMGLIQYTTWRIVPREEAKGDKNQINELVEDGGEWALVEDVKIEANRLLVPTVKSKCEGNWRGIQKGFAEHVRGLQAKEQSA